MRYLAKLSVVAAAICMGVVQASAQTKEPIKIGLVAPFSGDYAIYGEGYDRGIAVWKEQFGDVTIDGRKIELVKVDERCDVNTGLAAYRREASAFVAVFGPACSGVVRAVAPLADAAKRPMLFLGHGMALTENRPVGGYLFRMTQPDSKILDIFAESMLKRWKNEGKKKIAVLHDTTVAYGSSGDIVKAKAQPMGMEVVADEKFDLGTKDFTGQLLKVRQSGAEAAIVVTYAADEARLLNQMSELKINIPIAGGGDTPYLASIEKGHTQASSGALEGVYFYSDYVQGDTPSQIKEFDKRFNEKFNLPVLDINYEGWLAMNLIVKALQAPGATAGGEALRDALQNIKYDLGGRVISFLPNGDQTILLTYIGQIVNGQPKLVELIQTPRN